MGGLLASEKSADVAPAGRGRSAAAIHAALAELREEVVAEADRSLARWRPRVERDAYLPSAENLAAYLALRGHDLRDLQLELMPLGLSSLGRCEARVLPNLDAVLAALGALAGSGGEAPGPRAYFRGHELLRAQTEAVLGPTPRGRDVRIMVTLPSEAAERPELAATLVAAGMDVARVNCAHDNPEAWRAMAANVRAAAAAAGRSCRICFDLTGPRARVASTTVPPDARLRRGEPVLMGTGPVPVAGVPEHQFECSLPEVIEQLAPGARVLVNEGRLGARAERRVQGGWLLRVEEARDKGEHLRTEKGLNFPDSALRLPSLTPQDLVDLGEIAECADIVGLSFAQRPEDVEMAQNALGRLGFPDTALLLKIETELAIEALPDLIVQAAGRRPAGIMIARGDLAVEIGHARLAEVQEEILWVCEAAHVPVVWATQVLDGLVKKGVRHRGEMTDAAMAERAECVMLNKGPHVADAVELLAALLSRMEGHQFKKVSRMRALGTWSRSD